MNKTLAGIILSLMSSLAVGQTVDYSVIFVPQESGVEFTQITSDNDYVCMPIVKRSGAKVTWLTNRIIAISKNDQSLYFISFRNNTTNIFIKDTDKKGSSIQRTKRQSVVDFSISPDSKLLCFSEKNGNKKNEIYQTSSTNGYICRQVTNGTMDYSPIYSADMANIYFARKEQKSHSIWSYNIKNNFLSNYSSGMNPYPLKNDEMLCTRMNAQGRGEIWRVNFNSGVEECILSDPERSFSSPALSPNGRWILLVGSNVLQNQKRQYANTDIFVCRPDGTELRQLTCHAADDLSPIWSNNGSYIYFISQRGSATGTANVWRMTFTE